MCRTLLKKTQKDVTHQQCMGQQSRLSMWPDGKVLKMHMILRAPTSGVWWPLFMDCLTLNMKAMLSFEVATTHLTWHHIPEDPNLNIVLCILVYRYWCIRGPCYFHHQDRYSYILTMGVAGLSETPDFMASHDRQHSVNHQSHCV